MRLAPLLFTLSLFFLFFLFPSLTFAQASRPELWFHVTGRGGMGEGASYVDDFPKLFTNRNDWKKARLRYETHVFNMSARLTEVFEPTFLSEYTTKTLQNKRVAIDSGTPTWLSCQPKGKDYYVNIDLQIISQLKNAGVNIEIILMQSSLNKEVPDRLKSSCPTYNLDQRINDIAYYVKAIHTRYPHIKIGIIDATHRHALDNNDYKTVYRQLQTALKQQNLPLEYVVLDRIYENINQLPHQKTYFPYEEIIRLEKFVKNELKAKFGLIITAGDAGRISNQTYHQTVLKYVKEYNSAGGHPDLYYLTSWQQFPDKLLPEDSTDDFPMTKTLLKIDNLITALYGPRPSPTTTPGLPAQAGDLNGDGKADLFDFNLLVSKFGNPYTIFDFNTIVANYGK